MIKHFDPSILPDLPQTARLTQIVEALAQYPDVVAIWLGGSLARGAGDPYSDVDLRVAVKPEAFEPDRILTAAGSLHGEAVACLPFLFGDDGMLYHLLLRDGQIYDFFVQTTTREPTPETRLVLLCRDEAFGDQLAGGHDPVTRFAPAQAQEIEKIITLFWISQQKHQRALFRNLSLLAWHGEHMMQGDVIRLWYMLATGDDCGPLSRLTMHTFSPVVRAVNSVRGGDILELVGQPLRTPQEIVAATARLRAEVAYVGRVLAERLGFAYPTEAEATVERSWQRFLEDQAISSM